MTTLAQHYQEALQALANQYDEREAKNVVHYWLDARAGISRTDLVIDAAKEVEWPWFERDLARLAKLEPVQYVVGKAYFIDQLLEVNPSTLIPRPETEELVRGIVDYVPLEQAQVLDIGTGSGCIPLGVKSLRPNWSVRGIDIQEKAVETARKNATSWNLDVRFDRVDVFDLESLQADVIISNPPYIPEYERSTMERNVVGEEPDVALFVPDDSPLVFYETILRKGTLGSKAGSTYFGFEIHEDFGGQMLELGREYGLQDLQLKQDMQGKDRMIFGRYDG